MFTTSHTTSAMKKVVSESEALTLLQYIHEGLDDGAPSVQWLARWGLGALIGMIIGILRHDSYAYKVCMNMQVHMGIFN